MQTTTWKKIEQLSDSDLWSYVSWLSGFIDLARHVEIEKLELFEQAGDRPVGTPLTEAQRAALREIAEQCHDLEHPVCPRVYPYTWDAWRLASRLANEG